MPSGGLTMDEDDDYDSICDVCRFQDYDKNERPCTTCFWYVDGYLEAQNFKPKIYTQTNSIESVKED